MDQESFRRLLQTPHPSASTPTSRGSLLASGWTKSKPSKVIDATQPAFKPRKVKKLSESQYRDRAAERRVGEGNDYAEVEAVLEDFEKRNAGEEKSTLDEQRRYLGGDSAHSILVKGLDISLLEQNKARAAVTSTEDDEELEQAFNKVASSSKPQQTTSAVPKKRTREDLIRELKEKRAQNGIGGGGANGAREGQQQKTVEDEARLLEEAKKKGKFKPIGFKPVGESEVAGKKKKVKKAKEGEKDGERRKKKRRVESETKGSETMARGTTDENKKQKESTAGQAAALALATKSHEPESEVIPEDFDIFADAGEYEGIQVSDASDAEDADRPPRRSKSPKEDEQSTTAPRRWIETGDEPESQPQHDTKELLSSVLKSHAPEAATIRRDEDGAEGGEDGEIEQRPTKLMPLESSALPSIKDFLAMEKSAGGGGKSRKRGGKKGGAGAGEGGGDAEAKKKKNVEAKVERDYKRLKSYTDKKAGAAK